MSSPCNAAPYHSVKCVLFFLFFFLNRSGPQIIVPSIFAIAVVVEEVGSQGTVSERTPAQHHHHHHDLGSTVHLLLNRYRNRGRGTGSAVGGMSGRRRLLSVVVMKSQVQAHRLV